MTLSLLHGNALALPLADRSVHLVVTSPPYFALRSYRDDDEHFDGQLGSETTPLHFLAALWAVLDECWRVLRDDGSAWINLGDKFAGSGGHNNGGISKPDKKRKGWDVANNPMATAANATSRQAPDRYNQNAGGLRAKSRMLLPHRFAEGLIDPDYRLWTEHRAGLPPTATSPQWICRMDAVWSKLNGLPESVTDRVRASHENWFHLVKSERYYAALDEIREEHLHERVQAKPRPSGQSLPPRGPSDLELVTISNDPLGKLPGSVWTVATEPLTLPPHLPQHFAAFPSYFPRRIIAGWSPSGVCTVCGEGRRPVCEKTKEVFYGAGKFRSGAQQVKDGAAEVGWQQDEKWRTTVTITGYACACPTPTAPTTPARVLDPFSGTGTTTVVADALGRHGIGVDLSWDYHRIARWRFEDGGLRAKALGVEKPAKELDGQLSLLDEAG